MKSIPISFQCRDRCISGLTWYFISDSEKASFCTVAFLVNRQYDASTKYQDNYSHGSTIYLKGYQFYAIKKLCCHLLLLRKGQNSLSLVYEEYLSKFP